MCILIEKTYNKIAVNIVTITLNILQKYYIVYTLMGKMVQKSHIFIFLQFMLPQMSNREKGCRSNPS